MANLQIALEKTLPWEIGRPKEGQDPGGYTNLATDRGGPTRWGITEKVARTHGYEGDMKNFPKEWALQIYEKDYWRIIKLDEAQDQDIANQIFQAAVNQGTPLWSKYIQQICNRRLPGYEKLLSVDGIIGPKSIAAINKISISDRKGFSKTIYETQKKRYSDIIVCDPSQIDNKNGWDNRAEDFLITA